MKSMIIVVLLFLLALAAFLTRPSKDDFKRHLVAAATTGDKNIFSQGFDQFRAEHYADSCDYRDRLLWVDVQKNGSTVYTGAFSHWFNRATIQADVSKVQDQASKAGKTIDKGLEELKKH